MKKRRNLAVLAAGVLWISGMLGACGTGEAVPVMPVEELNGDVYEKTVTINARVTDEAAQTIYLTDRKKIEEIHVQPGETVHKGQVLLSYDKQSVALEMEAKELEYESIRLQLEKCRSDLEQLGRGVIPPEVIIRRETATVKGRQKINSGHETMQDPTLEMPGEPTASEGWDAQETLEMPESGGEAYPDQTSGETAAESTVANGETIFPGAEEPWEEEENICGELEQEREENEDKDESPWDSEEIEEDMDASMDPDQLKKEIASRTAETEKETRSLELKLRQAELDRKRLREEWEQSAVVSTLEGVVKTVKDPRTETVAPSEPVVQVVGQQGLYLVGQCPETLLGQLRIGDWISGYSYDSGLSFQAEVQQISPFPSDTSPEYSQEEGSFYPMTAFLEEDSGLKKDEWVELTVEMGESGAEGIRLNQAFIRRENGNDYVMKRGADGLLVRQTVELGSIMGGDSYEILRGLSLEDSIAFPYGKAVREGAKTREQSAAEFWEETYD